MTTTHESATVNRVASYFQPQVPEIPDDDFERQAFYTEAVLQAVAALRGLLNSKNEVLVMKAAQELMKMERTRLRHRRNVSGCREKRIPKWKQDQEWVESMNEKGPPTEADLEYEAVEAHSKQAQAELRKAEEAKPQNERKKVHSQGGRALVTRCLKEWKVTARSIPIGEFWAEYLQRPVLAKPVKRGPTVRQPAIPVFVPRRIDPTLVADWNVDVGPGGIR